MSEERKKTSWKFDLGEDFWSKWNVHAYNTVVHSKFLKDSVICGEIESKAFTLWIVKVQKHLWNFNVHWSTLASIFHFERFQINLRHKIRYPKKESSLTICWTFHGTWCISLFFPSGECANCNLKIVKFSAVFCDFSILFGNELKIGQFYQSKQITSKSNEWELCDIFEFECNASENSSD